MIIYLGNARFPIIINMYMLVFYFLFLFFSFGWKCMIPFQRDFEIISRTKLTIYIGIEIKNQSSANTNDSFCSRRSSRAFFSHRLPEYLLWNCFVLYATDVYLHKSSFWWMLFSNLCGFIFFSRHGRLQPFLVEKLRLHDTCGVHNLHGMPAILSAIFSIIYASIASTDNYKDSLNDIFPAMNWKNSSYSIEHSTPTIIGVNQ